MKKSLICINTYKSANLIKAFVWDYIDFVRTRDDFDFIVSLDGMDLETIAYCERFEIPLLYSEANEGVGISKNRVLEAFPAYDYYFFIEDDIELLNPKVFDIHIDLSQSLNIPHFSLFERRRLRKQVAVIEFAGYHVLQAMYGGAPFNFFTKQGLDTVGGFHTLFAQYKRFGHTEHSYRFVNNGLSQYPFNVIEECLDGYFRWNDPISRIKLNVEVSDNGLFVDEEALILQELNFFPVETLSPITISNQDNMTCKALTHKDTHYQAHKAKFYREMMLLNALRKMKYLVKKVIGR